MTAKLDEIKARWSHPALLKSDDVLHHLTTKLAAAVSDVMTLAALVELREKQLATVKQRLENVVIPEAEGVTIGPGARVSISLPLAPNSVAKEACDAIADHLGLDSLDVDLSP